MKKILVLDDEKPLLDTVSDVLADAGFHTKTITEGKHVFTAIEEYQPDIILLDYLAGESNGGEICHQIKTNLSTRNIPVIIMSAYPKVFLSLGSYGCDFFLSRPFALNDLLQAIESAFETGNYAYS